MELLTCIAGLVYLVYDAASKWNKDCPISLSATYYLWPKWVFPSVMVFTAFGLLPGWLDATAESNWQFLSFLACVGIASIGLVPDYRNDKEQYKWHMILAYVTCGLAAISLTFVIGGWYWFPILLGCGYLSDMEKFKRHYIYHLENALISSLILSILWKN